MSYIGNTSTTQAFSPAIDYFSGNGSTVSFTLSRPVASVAQVQVNVNNVQQNPSTAFTVNGNTITFTGAPSSGTNNIYVEYTSPITQTIAPGQGTVSSTQLTPTGVTAGTYGSSSAIPAITVDSTGRVTSASQSAFSSAYSGVNAQVFTSSGTFTVPAGVSAIKVTVVGGGGGGGSATANYTAGCGGAGAGVAIKYITGLTAGAAITATVGAGGGAVTSGGTSSFGAYCSATGGAGGASNTTNLTTSAGGTGTGGDINLTGGTGAGGRSDACPVAFGGGAGGGAGGGQGASGIILGSSAPSYIAAGGGGYCGGAGARGVSSESNGNNATGYGNGGGGATRATVSKTGGSGTSGIIIVEW